METINLEHTESHRRGVDMDQTATTRTEGAKSSTSYRVWSAGGLAGLRCLHAPPPSTFYPSTLNVAPPVLGCTTFYSAVRWAKYFECFAVKPTHFSSFLPFGCTGVPLRVAGPWSTFLDWPFLRRSITLEFENTKKSVISVRWSLHYDIPLCTHIVK